MPSSNKDAESDSWVAQCIEYEVATQGDSEEHALQMIEEAVSFHLEDLTKDEIDLIDNCVGSEPVIRKFRFVAPPILNK